MTATTRLQVTFPQMGQSVTEGTLVGYRVAVGDTVDKHEELCDISTDKVDSEVPAPAAGTVVELCAEPDTILPVGAPLLVLEVAEADADAAPPPPTGDGAPPERSPAPNTAASGSGAGTTTPTAAATHGASGARADGSGRFLSPAVRRLARERGVDPADLGQVPGTGRGGRPTLRDVQRWLDNGGGDAGAGRAAGTDTGADEERVALPAMRRTIARHMAESHRTVPLVTTVIECDLEAVGRRRSERKAASGDAPSWTAYLATACARALLDFPDLNARLEGDADRPGFVVRSRRVHLGIAVALGEGAGGLMVPVVRDAQAPGADALDRSIRDLARRARAGDLDPDAMHGGTFTLTNPGAFGSLLGTPLVNLPQTGILALGAITRRPWVVEHDDGSESLGIRWACHLSLSYDHRIVDGAHAARYLHAVAAHAQDPAALERPA